MTIALAEHYQGLSASERAELLATCRSHLDAKFAAAQREYDDCDDGSRLRIALRLQEIVQLRYSADRAEKAAARNPLDVVDAYLEALQGDAVWQDLGVELGLLDEPRSNLATAWGEGFAAGRSGQLRAANPYKGRRPKLAQQWDIGWKETAAR